MTKGGDPPQDGPSDECSMWAARKTLSGELCRVCRPVPWQGVGDA